MIEQTTFIDQFLEEEIDCSDVKVTEFEVRPVTIQMVKKFVETWHYSQSTNGLSNLFVFGLYYKHHLIGAIIYGSLSMAGTWKKYGEIESDVIELKRLCCIDKTKKNTESYFIGKTIKFLKKYSKCKVIISYADTFHGHSCIIYKATNFEHVGLTEKGRVIKYKNKFYHDKCIRSYDDHNQLKPFAIEIIKALETGEAVYIPTPSKHIYVYRINRKNTNKQEKLAYFEQKSLIFA